MARGSDKGAERRAGKEPARSSREVSQRSPAILPAGYAAFVEDLKARIRAAQVKAALSVNRELVALYWDIGKSIVERQRAEGWGTSVIDRLAADIHASFPGIEGFSPSNVSRRRAFYLAWTEEVRDSAQAVPKLRDADSARFVPEVDGRGLPRALAEIPWGHNIVLLFKVKNPVQRLWYARMALEHGWSRAVLIHQIESRLLERQGKAVTNFKATLPPEQSDLAQQTIKDPYVFDFLTLAEDVAERQLEQGLSEHLRKFLLELGVGFAFVGRQHHLEIDGEDFYIDLLFYHLRLRCFVVIDLKAVPFKPEFAGKMNFYLSAVDDLLRHPDDRPSIGIILCKTRKRLVAEYALRDTRKPIGVSECRLTGALPSELKGSLPSIKQLEAELGKAEAGEPEV